MLIGCDLFTSTLDFQKISNKDLTYFKKKYKKIKIVKINPLNKINK